MGKNNWVSGEITLFGKTIKGITSIEWSSEKVVHVDGCDQAEQRLLNGVLNTLLNREPTVQDWEKVVKFVPEKPYPENVAYGLQYDKSYLGMVFNQIGKDGNLVGYKFAPKGDEINNCSYSRSSQ